MESKEVKKVRNDVIVTAAYALYGLVSGISGLPGTDAGRRA